MQNRRSMNSVNAHRKLHTACAAAVLSPQCGQVRGRCSMLKHLLHILLLLMENPAASRLLHSENITWAQSFMSPVFHLSVCSWVLGPCTAYQCLQRGAVWIPVMSLESAWSLRRLKSVRLMLHSRKLGSWSYPIWSLRGPTSAAFQKSLKFYTSTLEKCSGMPPEVGVPTCEVGANRSTPTSQVWTLTSQFSWVQHESGRSWIYSAAAHQLLC